MKSRFVYLGAAVLLAVVAMAGCSQNSNNPIAPANLTDTTPPPAPTGVAVDFAAELNRPVVTWNASAAGDVASYDVYQYLPDPSRDNAYVKINSAPVTATQYLLDGVGQDTQAYFRVRAVDQAGNHSAYSATCGAVLQASTPGGGGNPGPRNRGGD